LILGLGAYLRDRPCCVFCMTLASIARSTLHPRVQIFLRPASAPSPTTPASAFQLGADLIFFPERNTQNKQCLGKPSVT
jgi:hypothetical protein